MLESIDPRDVLLLFLFLCGAGLGLIVGILIGIAEGRRAELINANAEMSGLHMRLFAGKAVAAEMEARAAVEKL